ncbi:MAG: ABC transporter ATP-binding protein [Bacillota bacterium]|nr:ABC transporter ATP-binding protein [Bacillota bacterium]
MKKIMYYIRAYRTEAVLAPFFKLLEALMDLFVPIVVARIINNGIARGDMGYVWQSFAMLIALTALGMVFSFTAQWFAAKASVGAATGLRQDLFDHIQSLSYTEIDRLGTDTLITRMTSDVNQVQTGINMSLRLLLRSPFIVFGAMIMAFAIDVRCALIFLGAIPVLSIVVFGIMFRSIPMFARAQAALDRLLGTTRENLTGVRVIRAFCKEEDSIREFEERNDTLTRMNEAVGKLSALMNPGTYLLINAATILLIQQGAIRVELGAIRQGDVVALYNYMAQIIVELIKLASLIITINKSIACAERISAMFDVKNTMTYRKMPQKAGGYGRNGSGEEKTGTDGTCGNTEEKAAADCTIGSTEEKAAADGSDTDSSVCFRNVTFSYAGSGADAVTGISFETKSGETIGVIGGTGSGKSTVVNLIPRFYDPDSGEVWIGGKDARDYAEGELIRKIGVIPQKAVLFEGTIRENLRWGNPDASDRELWEAIDLAQAREVVEGKDGMLDAKIEQNGRNLSGGQRQRLTIARALVKKPEILIMDDSASALDYSTDLALRRAIRSLPGNMSVFIVSQRTSSVREADRILVLDDGKLVGNGTHEELMRDCEVYREIYYSQFSDERPEEETERNAERNIERKADEDPGKTAQRFEAPVTEFEAGRGVQPGEGDETGKEAMV